MNKTTEPALNRLIRSTYKLAETGYTFISLPWYSYSTIQEGWKAPQAASVIHADFEKGFIKAG